MKRDLLCHRLHKALRTLLVIAVLIVYTNSYAQKFPNLALTPPMAWNSWNKFGCDVNEQMIREMADAMVSSGMKDAGYMYINIDNCWHGQRDSLGVIHADSARFPHGIKALAEYVHSKGLKIGIYSDGGSKTCAGRPGSRGHEYQDAITYAAWGIDYLKYDWCNTEGLTTRGAYTTMRDALYAAGRPIVFSICEWGSTWPWEWAKDVGNLWRTTGDISDNFASFIWILDQQDRDRVRQSAGPGHWNDPDMLEVGNGGMTVSEDRAEFSMWCMLAAPLIAGNDLRTMTAETKDILENKETIAVDQDSLGVEGFKYSSNDSVQVWCKPLEKGDWALCFLNRGLALKNVPFNWHNENIADSLSGRNANFDKTVYTIRDLWTKKDIGTTKNALTVDIPGHDVVMLRLIKK